MYKSLRLASHFPIIPESEGNLSVVQSDEICSDCFGPIVWTPLLDSRAKFISDSEKLPPIIGLTCQPTANHLRLLFFPDANSPTGPILHPIIHPTVRSFDPSGNGTPGL